MQPQTSATELTPNERYALALVAEGNNPQVIAKKLGVSVDMLGRILKSAKAKIGTSESKVPSEYLSRKIKKLAENELRLKLRLNGAIYKSSIYDILSKRFLDHTLIDPNEIEVIEKDKTVEAKPLNDRIDGLVSARKVGTDAEFRQRLLDAFPEIAITTVGELSQFSTPLPTSAPADWSTDRKVGEDPFQFVATHYQPWLGKGLNRSDIRRLDFKLYNALSQAIKRHGLPPDLDLPTLAKENDRWVDRLKSGEPLQIDGQKDATRIARAVYRRASKEK